MGTESLLRPAGTSNVCDEESEVLSVTDDGAVVRMTAHT